MGDVIRPDFDHKLFDEEPRSIDLVFQALHVFGDALGCRLCLIRDENSPAGDVLKVVAGRTGGCEFETVAVLPNTPEGRTDAASVGMAILRTLQLVANGFKPPA